MITASCPTCGKAEFASREMQVQVCSATGEATYSFLCKLCHLIVNKVADEGDFTVLTGRGVKVVRWDLPAELSESKVGPPITYDDLLEFHFQLDQDAKVVLDGLRSNNDDGDQRPEY
jgi:hypothetical protein